MTDEEWRERAREATRRHRERQKLGLVPPRKPKTDEQRARNREATRRYKEQNREKVKRARHAKYWEDVDKSRAENRDWKKKQYAANPKKFSERAQSYRADNPERYRANALRRYWLGPEKYRAAAREYYHLHSDERNARHARWRASNPDKVLRNNRRHAQLEQAAVEFLRSIELEPLGDETSSKLRRAAALAFVRELGLLP